MSRKEVGIVYTGATAGADPELFIVNTKTKHPVVLGSERIFPKEQNVPGVYGESSYGDIAPDGVQIELHPRTSSCRQSFGAYMAGCLEHLHKEVAKHPGLAVSYDPIVTVRMNELVKLSDHAKFLGCTPSFNFYGRAMPEVNGLEYRRRSAAGHIHLGSSFIWNEKYRPKAAVKPERLVPALDILVGIPAVLCDQNPAQRERRKLYGRAGEYRLPAYGIEYRTLSNFWLLSYQLMSLMVAQSRNALGLAFCEHEQLARSYSYNCKPATSALTTLIQRADLTKVEKAINHNDRDLAFSIYEKAIKPLFQEVQATIGLGLETEAGEGMLLDFEYFISKPMTHWFKGTPVQNWRQRERGWENFACCNIRPQRQKLV